MSSARRSYSAGSESAFIQYDQCSKFPRIRPMAMQAPSTGQTLPPGQTAGESFSCDDDHLAADYYSLYATDQVDVTDRLKVRAGVRQDWWNEALTPLINVPGGTFNNEGVPLPAQARVRSRP
jgi:outer membrane receptor protein involved in Fe transport